MHSIGIDIGSEFCKLVLVDGEKKILSTDLRKIGGDPEGTAHELLKAVAKRVNISKKDMKKKIPIVSCGRNGDLNAQKGNIEYILEYNCLAEAALFIDPKIKTIVDTGGFVNKVIKMDNGTIFDYSVNDICSSGAGIFLTLVSKSLDISLSDLGALARDAPNTISITSQCSIFAESEVIYLMNEGKSISEISAGVCESIVGRLVPQIQKLNPEPNFLFCGGVAKNLAIKESLEKFLAMPFVRYEDQIDPQFVAAFGAALLGLSEKKKEGSQ